jgi:hypothetical protein
VIRAASRGVRLAELLEGASPDMPIAHRRRASASAARVPKQSCLIDAAEHLLGGPVIPECPEGVLYFAEAGWHTVDGTGVRGVKFALTLQRRRGPG